jgi:hypothetical protein
VFSDGHHIHKFFRVKGKVKVKVMESRYRPGVAQRIPGGVGSQMFMTFGT